MSQDRELWVNPSSGQRYILPKGLAFQSGDTPITSVNGTQWMVFLKDIEAYAASEAEVQLFMLADLRMALGSAPVIRPQVDLDSDESSEWDSEDSSEDSEIEQALSKALIDGVSEEGINRFLNQHPEVSAELLNVLDAELNQLRQSFSELGMWASGGTQALTPPDMLRAFAARLIEQANKLEAEQELSTPDKKDV